MSKILGILMAASVPLPAFATSQGLDVIGASFASGKVISVSALCASNPKCKSHGLTRVELVFGLNGCRDIFGGASYSYDTTSHTLYVSGINLNTRQSTQIKCIRQPTQEYVITVPGGSPKMDVVFLSKSGL